MITCRKTHVTWCVLRHIRSLYSTVNDNHSIVSLFSKTGNWATELNNDVRIEIENHWKPQLKEHDIKYRSLQTSDKSEKEKFYVLSMFPYPSGSLHMGHVRVYTISDAMARFNRLGGKEVIHPMGWDAFGLPAENAAIERGEIPQDWTKKNIESMKKQLEDLCCSFDWDRELATCDPKYYKWTQYIFLKMFEAGLVYRKQAEVNWDPIDQTVLADEQINEEGLSWRSGAKVEKRNLPQWYIQTTKYAKSLIDGLSEVNADLWGDVISNQKNWIGKLAYPIHFKYKVNGQVQEDCLTVKMTHLEYIYGISHINITSLHPLFQIYQVSSLLYTLLFEEEKTIYCITAVHPLTDSDIPVYYTEQSIQLDNTAARQDSHVAIPSINSSDQLEADRLGLSWIDVIDSKAKIVNSNQVTFKMKMLGEVTSSRLTDWLISRQRYWGTPIPIIHCPKCQVMNIEDLPVELPRVKQLSNKGSSPLSQIEEWVNCQCPKCVGDAKRETDTMDTFVDSSWYYLRYLDVNNQQLPVSKQLADQYLPVDLYIGGKEHAVLHLYFARFFNHFLNDIGILKHREPFIDLLTQGMVLGQSCQVKSTGQYVPADQVNIKGNGGVEKATGEPVELQWEKMSKSKYNGVDPQDVIKEYGVDPTRLCILSSVSPMSNRYWSEKEYKGILKWQYRIWVLIGDYMKYSKQDYTTSTSDLIHWNQELFEARNSSVHEVTYQMRKNYMINAAISRLQKFTNILKKCPPGIMRNCEEFERCLADLIIMLAPFSPMFACEYWAGVSSTVNFTHSLYQWDRIVLDQTWPLVDDNYQYEMSIKKNERDQFSIKLPLGRLNDWTYEEAVVLAQSDPQFMKHFKNVHIKHKSFRIEKDYKAWLTMHVGKEKKTRESENIADEHLNAHS
ncbi:hypothetical protein LOTGIDRAFT_216293 [Lottia gigantea]|uniref:leucine--tRNA ligase n=1 Tax=Lottia gigantea TaxID=225164 RepID=V4AI15_LOTGI|nr:hypothetical protein LOTGIDRAFT_216293 [Lottia gigantea]ESO93051.1 hypothetical protein LOTGIDRAFT_216293 [Lottia gigantea]